MKPPSHLDSAQVLYWAWSGAKPIGIIYDTSGNIVAEIYGFAICILSGAIYRFSCDHDWEVQGDSDFPSIQAAMDAHDYQSQHLDWEKFDSTDIEDLISQNQRVKFYSEVGGRRVIQKIITHLNEHNCDGMDVQLVAEDTWLLSVLKKDIQIANEVARQNVDT